jgi:hypothetical protein
MFPSQDRMFSAEKPVFKLTTSYVGIAPGSSAAGCLQAIIMQATSISRHHCAALLPSGGVAPAINSRCSSSQAS